MQSPSVFSLISAFRSSVLCWWFSLSVIFWSHLQATVRHQDLWEVFSKISVLSVVVYVVLFLIVNCNRWWHKFDVIGENWWALSSLCQIKPSEEEPFGLIPLLGRIIVWVSQGLATVRLWVLISCSGSEHQRTCIWVCRPRPVANPPLRCPSVLWEGSAGVLAGSEKTKRHTNTFHKTGSFSGFYTAAGSSFPPQKYCFLAIIYSLKCILLFSTGNACNHGMITMLG